MIAACLFSIGPVEGVPRNMSGRVILAMWWFMILIVTAMYTANLAAFLTVTRMQVGINSISDLIIQDKVKWGTVNGTNAQILLEAAKSPDLQEVYKRMVNIIVLFGIYNMKKTHVLSIKKTHVLSIMHTLPALHNAHDLIFLSILGIVISNQDILFISITYTAVSQQPVNSVEEGFRRARETDYIFFYGGAIVAFEANTKPCNLQIVGEQLFSFGYEMRIKYVLV